MNNIFGVCCNCPAMISDKGRLFHDYSSTKNMINNIMKVNNLKNNNELRLYLQNNGNSLNNLEKISLENKKCMNNNKNINDINNINIS